MSDVDIRKIKPLPDDVLLCRIPKHEVETATIFFEDDHDVAPMQYFTVISVGDSVNSVSPGDTVCIPWTKITDPLEGKLDGKIRQFGVTNQIEILGVIEQ